MDGPASTQLQLYDICRIPHPQKNDILTRKRKIYNPHWSTLTKINNPLKMYLRTKNQQKRTSVEQSSPLSPQKSEDMLGVFCKKRDKNGHLLGFVLHTYFSIFTSLLRFLPCLEVLLFMNHYFLVYIFKYCTSTHILFTENVILILG